MPVALLPCLLLCCAKAASRCWRFASVSATASFFSFILFLSLCSALFSITALENLLAVNLAILSRRGSFFCFLVNSGDRRQSASRSDDPGFASVDFLF